MTALVGPLPRITFRDGSKQVYDIPPNTCDPRYSACSDRHPACDCREAHMAEDRGEFKYAMDDARTVIAHLLDAPCPADKRARCKTCRAALTAWLGRHESVWGGAR